MTREHMVVHMLQKTDRLQILATAMFVRYPLSLLARIVLVKHRGHGIDTQSIHMKTIAPVKCVSGEIITHLVPAVVENISPPVRMLSATRIIVLVKCRSIKAGQRIIVLRKMRRHPVEYHADAGRVQRIHQRGKIVRCPVATRWRKKTSHLIAPRRIIGVLSHGQKLDMRETHLRHVTDQFSRKIAVRK